MRFKKYSELMKSIIKLFLLVFTANIGFCQIIMKPIIKDDDSNIVIVTTYPFSSIQETYINLDYDSDLRTTDENPMELSMSQSYIVETLSVRTFIRSILEIYVPPSIDKNNPPQIVSAQLRLFFKNKIYMNNEEVRVSIFLLDVGASIRSTKLVSSESGWVSFDVTNMLRELFSKPISPSFRYFEFEVRTKQPSINLTDLDNNPFERIFLSNNSDNPPQLILSFILPE